MLKELSNDYKETSIGLIPSNWEVKKLGEISKNKNSSLSINALSDNFGDYILYGASGLLKGIDFYVEEDRYISIVKDGAGVGRVFLCEKQSSVLGTMGYIKAVKETTCLNYLYFLYQTINFEKFITGSTIPHIYFSSYSLIKVPLPPLPEQQKIANILLTWDDAINTTKKVLKNLKVVKKSMTIGVLSGRIRFEKFSNDNKINKRDNYQIPNDWEIKSLSSVLKQVKNPVKPEKDVLYKQLGIRSHAKGIFYKESVTGESLGNKSVFAIEPDCFILNIVFAWEHAIAKTSINELGMIVSHRFPMYKPLATKLDLNYLLFFFKSKRGKDLLGLASPGGAGRNKTLGQKEFLKLKIPIPSIKEQKAIADFLETFDYEIKLYQQKLETLQLQKKGLMQQLLTGKVRTI
ncbi:restriction endonuclease subunit S [Flavobacterium sp. FPG59]|uniref:restriction endonuclease subunit S n=1 Tax=Flavobacterium sp. FPG59 TaxID=1929267 RepID=UPI000A375212|nr:restriction endonuclease subunit S [Flavobacterium sp. FPG59]OUD35326.1 hypothetical protein FPG59_10635 [Flavobacterium sp. FPG59]